ncbi:MAG: ATP-binding protein [Candidatus Melainabacteria bacterium]|nr:ATP-binding protein [Candidatus Melainabacteria bacterium]
MNETIEKTNWYIITGGPSTGKSKTIDHLAYLGYLIRPEVARILIDDELSKGKTIEEIRGDEKSFEHKILKIKIETEETAPKNDLIFWERGLPDSIVYIKRCSGDHNLAVQISKRRQYKGVFILDVLPVYDKDYARTETSSKAKEIHEALYNCYTELGYKVIRVPVAPISERAEFIIKQVHKGN